jgi:hypothetical protein
VLGFLWLGVGDFEVVRYCRRLAAEFPVDIIINLNIIKPVKLINSNFKNVLFQQKL